MSSLTKEKLMNAFCTYIDNDLNAADPAYVKEVLTDQCGLSDQELCELGYQVFADEKFLSEWKDQHKAWVLYIDKEDNDPFLSPDYYGFILVWGIDRAYWEYEILDPNFTHVEGGILENPGLSIDEARDEGLNEAEFIRHWIRHWTIPMEHEYRNDPSKFWATREVNYENAKRAKQHEDERAGSSIQKEKNKKQRINEGKSI